MTRTTFYADTKHTNDCIRNEGARKHEHQISSPQNSSVTLVDRRVVINLASNNYLGLANHPDVVDAAAEALAENGFGMSSVRFITGTTPGHVALEAETAHYVGAEAALTFASCFEANTAVFEPLLTSDDAIVSDSLNHASIIDGIRLCKAHRYTYPSGDYDALADTVALAAADGARTIMIVTDGVFSMDGRVAQLDTICDIADRHDALVMVDDCHSTGIIGPSGSGTPALFGRAGRVDIVTGTYGKALGGAMGGFIAGRHDIVELLRQRARPYVFSNALSPPLVAGARQAIRLARSGDDLRTTLHSNTVRFRHAMRTAGFNLSDGDHPIVPILFDDDDLARTVATELLNNGVLTTAFSHPIVPHGAARIRAQISAVHTTDEIDAAINAFEEAARSTGAIG